MSRIWKFLQCALTEFPSWDIELKNCSVFPHSTIKKRSSIWRNAENSLSEHLRLTKYSMANAIKRGELQVEHLPFLSFLLLLFDGLWFYAQNSTSQHAVCFSRKRAHHYTIKIGHNLHGNLLWAGWIFCICLAWPNKENSPAINK